MTALQPQPGDIGFCHSRGVIGAAIRLGERLRFRSGDFYNHTFIVGNNGTVIQAVGNGVTANAQLDTVAPGGSYEIVHVPGADPLKVLAFAQSQVGKKYGWVSIASVALKILLPRWFPLPSVRTDNTWICSALGGESARFGGWIFDWPDIYGVVPSEFYAAIKGVSVRDAAKTALAV